MERTSIKVLFAEVCSVWSLRQAVRPACRFHRHHAKTRKLPYLDFVELIVRQFNRALEQGSDGSPPRMWRLTMSGTAMVNGLKAKTIQ
jgi:hypothetical protein